MERLNQTTTGLEGNLAIAPKVLRPALSICVFSAEDKFAASVSLLLGSDRYVITLTSSPQQFLRFIDEDRNIDCLLIEDYPELPSLLEKLREKSTLFPATIVTKSEADSSDETSSTSMVENVDSRPRESQDRSFLYHEAEFQLPMKELNELEEGIEGAIAKFLNLSPTNQSTNSSSSHTENLSIDETTRHSLNQQQKRLAEKLRERLGYLGVYYKRNPQNFLRNIPPRERRKFIDQLKTRYRQIVLSYFSEDSTLNNQIDEFVNLSFFADVPVTQIVEIHMDLMEEFSQQLKLEGRSEEILLDYRLTLIDTIAHLCEMYRRSVPQES